MNFSQVVFLLLCMALNYSCNKKDQIKTLTLAHSLPSEHPVHKALQYFAYTVKEISESQLKIKIYPNGQLGSEREVLELIQIGSVGITKVSAGTISNFVAKYKVLTIPYLFKNDDHAWTVLKGKIGQDILNSGVDFNLKGLTFYDAGSRSFYTKNKPIYEADDIKGMKLRVMDDPIAIEMIKLLGGSATPMSFGELYTALQQGIVDGAENNTPSVVSSNHFEVCKYYSLNHHTMIPDVLVIGTHIWNSLTKIEQGWVQDAAQKSLIVQRKLWKEAEAKNIEFLMKYGVNVIEPEIVSFQKATQPIKDRLSRDAQIGKLLSGIEELIISE